MGLPHQNAPAPLRARPAQRTKVGGGGFSSESRCMNAAATALVELGQRSPDLDQHDVRSLYGAGAIYGGMPGHSAPLSCSGCCCQIPKLMAFRALSVAIPRTRPPTGCSGNVRTVEIPLFQHKGHQGPPRLHKGPSCILGAFLAAFVVNKAVCHPVPTRVTIDVPRLRLSLPRRRPSTHALPTPHQKTWVLGLRRG
jgi:hypothetical protein